MDTFATRLEIRRRLQARLGLVTSAAQAPLNQEQFNEFIRAAAQEVHSRCQWVRTMRETTVNVGIDQRFLNYPANAGPGEVQAIGVWDAGDARYLQLVRGRIGLDLGDEPLVETGEPGSVAGRGRPCRYAVKDQIELWPRPDQAYRLRIDHTVSPEFADDGAMSVVDAECIVLWAMADAYEFQGDGDLARTQRAKCEARLARLAAAQSGGQQVRRGRWDRGLVANRRPGSDYVPTSGVWPSVVQP